MTEDPTGPRPLTTVEMLRAEFEAHVGSPLDDEEPEFRDAPVSHKAIAAASGTVGLALSGGGIRSATFGLGVLQALSKLKLLSSIDYLSTVSGGGYIGGWLAGWAHRQARGIEGVMEELGERTTLPEHEAAPVKYLRAYSNYLTPRIGLLSSDTWTIVGTYLRNLIVNWLVVVPYFVLALLIPLAGVDVLRMSADSIVRQPLLGGYAVIDVVTVAALLLLVAAMAVIGNSLPTSAGGNIARRLGLVADDQNQFLWKATLPLVLAGITLATAWLSFMAPRAAADSWIAAQARVVPQWLVFTILGVIVHLAAFSVYVGRALLAGITDSRTAVGRADVWVWRDVVAVVVSGGAGGWLAWVAAARLIPALTNGSADATSVYVVVAVPLFLLSFVVGLTIYTALASGLTSEEDREWLARAGAWFLAVAAGWVAVSGIALLGPAALQTLWQRLPGSTISLGGLSGALSLWLGGGGLTRARADEKAGTTWTDVAADWGLKLAAPVFVILLAVLLATAVTSLRDLVATAWSASALAATGTVAFAATAVIVLVNVFVNSNVFSLHGMYRDRLIRAYLGASRSDRKPHAFTGFDANDNVPLVQLAAPYFGVRDWPFLFVLAKTLLASDPPANISAARDELVAIDNLLIEKTFATSSWDEAVIHDLVDRWNHALMLLGPVKRRREAWNALVEARAGSAEFGEHEWWLVRDIGRAVDDGRDSMFAGILIGRAPDWSRRVREVATWDGTSAAALIEELNGVILAIDFAAVGGARAGSAAAPAPGVGTFPADPSGLRARLTGLVPRPRKSPLLIVNTAINLVSGENLAWQQRKAASFTFTPLHAGSAVVGYRGLGGTATDTKCYGGKSGVSLGTAMTISGAAANPNMGYHSSPVVTLLLALFNARLGAWIGNPADARRFTHAYPRGHAIPMVLREAFGLTDRNGGYVHLSDGGHFENLGLYELVRRGCRCILVSDAGCDQRYAFEDLGNAIRKIRIDLGIEIEFEGFRVGPLRSAGADSAAGHRQGEYIAIGRIHYGRRVGGNHVGRLLYIKPALFEQDEAIPEPIDVRQYGRANPAYPHESTTDQWFSESQFESYRALGEHIVRTVGLGGNPAATGPPDMAALFDCAEVYLKRRGARTVVPPRGET